MYYTSALFWCSAGRTDRVQRVAVMSPSTHALPKIFTPRDDARRQKEAKTGPRNKIVDHSGLTQGHTASSMPKTPAVKNTKTERKNCHPTLTFPSVHRFQDGDESGLRSARASPEPSISPQGVSSANGVKTPTPTTLTHHHSSSTDPMT